MNAQGTIGQLSVQQVDFFRRMGYLLLTERLAREAVEKLRATIDRLGTLGAEPCERDSHGQVTRISDLFARDQAIRELVQSHSLLEPLESLLGPNIEFLRNRHNHATMGTEKTYRSRLHRDVLQWSRSIVSVAVFLDDSTSPTAATRIIPGSQFLPFVGAPNNGGTWMDEHSLYADLMDQALPVPAASGDILVFDGLVFHGGGRAESSSTPRRLITLAYTSVDELLAVDSRGQERVLVRGVKISRGSPLMDSTY